MKIKIGYTTGTCAQAASKAACQMLNSGKLLKRISVQTPLCKRFILNLIDQKIDKNWASCAVVKNSGEDIDSTDGIKIYAKARYSSRKGVTITGGKGIGRVTKSGLAVGVGEYAINPVPRKMILKEVSKFLPVDRGIEITISAPAGRRLAKHTSNPRLGIKGGISIIGTTGVVLPKSTDAYKKSLSLQLDVLKAAGYKKAVLVLGYVGEKYCKIRNAECRMRNVSKNNSTFCNPHSTIKIGDHIGFMLKECVKKKISNVLLIGHIGKLVKVANGQFNTHYKFGDRRIETIVSHAKSYNASCEVIRRLAKQKTAEATIQILRENSLMDIFNSISKTVIDRIRTLTNGALNVDCVILSLKGEILGESTHNWRRAWQ